MYNFNHSSMVLALVSFLEPAYFDVIPHFQLEQSLLSNFDC